MSDLKFSPAEAAEEVREAFRTVREKYRAGGLEIELYILHAIHSADCMMTWGQHEAALSVLGDVGAPLLKRELPQLIGGSKDLRHHVLSLGRQLRDAGLSDGEDLVAFTGQTGVA